MVFGNLNPCGINSCVSKFAWRLLCHIQVMWLYDDLKLTIKSENRVLYTQTPSCCNSCLLKLVYSLWYDKLVMCHYGDLKLAIFEVVLATLKSENMVYGNRSLCGVNSCVSKFAWRLLCHIRVMWLYGDLKLTIFKMLWSP